MSDTFKPRSRHVVDLLVNLVDKSLVVYEAQPDGPGRYRLLETVRQYANERLRERDRRETLRRRHCDYFRALADEAFAHLKGPEQAVWMERVETDQENLRATLQFLQQDPTGGADGLEMVGSLGPFWRMRGHLSEGWAWFSSALAHPDAAGRTAARARALMGAGNQVSCLGDYVTARALFEEYLSIVRALGDPFRVALALHCLGNVALEQSDFAEARRLYEESLSVFRELGKKEYLGSSLVNLASVALEQGDLASARRFSEESLAVRQEMGDRRGISDSLRVLGNLAQDEGDYAEASRRHHESLAIQRELGEKPGIATSLHNLGNVAKAQGDYASAYALYQESLAIQREIEDRRGMVEVLEALAALAQIQGQFERAAWLLGASWGQWEDLGVSYPQSKREKYESTLVEALGAKAFAAASARGRAMTLDQAVEYALKGIDAGKPEP